MIWYDMIWYDMIWYDTIWYDVMWYDMIWYDICYCLTYTPTQTSSIAACWCPPYRQTPTVSNAAGCCLTNRPTLNCQHFNMFLPNLYTVLSSSQGQLIIAACWLQNFTRANTIPDVISMVYSTSSVLPFCPSLSQSSSSIGL